MFSWMALQRLERRFYLDRMGQWLADAKGWKVGAKASRQELGVQGFQPRCDAANPARLWSPTQAQVGKRCGQGKKSVSGQELSVATEPPLASASDGGERA